MIAILKSYKLSGNELVPERIKAFGETGKEHNAAMLAVSDYNKETNTLVTLMLNTESKKDKTVNMVWLQPQ